MLLILLVIVLILALGGLPQWPYAQPYGYGYYPSAFFAIVVIVLLVLLLRGYRL